MADEEHVQILRRGYVRWNAWRRDNPSIEPDLSHLDFETVKELCPVVGPDLSYFDLSGADLRASSLRNGGTIDANFEGAYLAFADLCYSHFARCNFKRAVLRVTRLGSASFVACDLQGAELAYSTAEEADFTGSKLVGVNMQHMRLAATSFANAHLQNALVYGISAWDLDTSDATQSGLIITPPDVSAITVDDLELSQFIYLILNNSRLRQVLDTITSKVVLILGRFTPERKPALDLLREAIRERDLVPVLFDFERPMARSFLETASTLAHMARFVIADFSDQGDVRREVQHIATILQRVPIVPLLHRDQSGVPLTLQDLDSHPALLPLVRYGSLEDLAAQVDDHVVRPALELDQRLHRR